MIESDAILSASRKDDHVRLALEQAKNRHQQNDFDEINFVHHALNTIDIADVSLCTNVLGYEWRAPIYINAMTGGSAETGKINASLARVAAHTGLAIASGSMSPIFKDEEAETSFKVLRTLNPDGVVFANINANVSLEQAKRAIGLIEANALQIHINPVQELAMPEGDRAFKHWLANISTIVAGINVPVIIKEVGFGISRETAEKLYDLGVTAIDTAGKGGTNFARIEQARAEGEYFAELSNWGLSAVKSLLDIGDEGCSTIFASGGVRNSMDVARSLSLGAKAVGVAGGFLHTLQTSGEEALISQIETWQDNLIVVQALLGAPTPERLQHSQLIVSGSVAEFCARRNIDLSKFALRGREGQTV